MSTTSVGLTLAEAYQAMTGLETVQYGTKFMVNNSGTWAEASEAVMYNVIKNGGAKAVGSVQRIVPSAAKYTGIGVDYSAILGTNVQTALGSLPTTQEILFKVPTATGGNALATPTQLSNAMRAALQNSGAEISSTALQPITKMEIVQSSGQTAIKTTAKGILTKVPWNLVMRAAAVAQGVQLGVDFVEANPQLATKLSNAVFGTNIDPEYIADIVENTTVWANVRDGAIFIAEDVIEAIKDVFITEGVYDNTGSLETEGVYLGEEGTFDGYRWGSYSKSDNPSDKFFAAGKTVVDSYELISSSTGRVIAVICSNTTEKYKTNYCLCSNAGFKTRSNIGTWNNTNNQTYPIAPTISKHEGWEAKSSIVISGNRPVSWTGLMSYYNENYATRYDVFNGGINVNINIPWLEAVLYVPNCPDSGNVGANIAQAYFYDNDRQYVITPQPKPQAGEGFTLIPGATYPTAGRPVRDSYPSWYNNGTDTISDIDDQGNISNKRWYPVNIFDPQTQPEAQDGTTPDDDKRKAIVNTVDDSIEDNLQNDPQTEPKPQTYPEPNPEPGTDLQRVNPNPPSIDSSDGESPDPTSPILTTAITSGLAYIYNPTLTETKALGRVLWTANFVENLKKIFVNPMDGIIGFHILYATPKTKAPEEIVLGYYGTGVNSKVVTNQYVTIDCGRLGIDEVFNDARDYDPYTTAALYLPFIGIVDLKANDVINSYVNIKYNVDVLTGTCIAFVEVAKKGAEGTLYQFVGNCAVEIPLSSGNYTAVITSLLSVASSAVGGAMIGGVPGALFGGFKGAAINASRTKMQVIQSGNLGANAGAMGIRKPFIIIRRPVTKDAYAYNKQYGYPAFKWTMLGNMHGFTRVKAVHIDFVECTDEEEQMIIAALKEGVQL